MALITDRDLVVIEPAVFTLAGSVATSLLSATDADVSGTEVTSATSDFAAAGIGEDHVAVVDGTPIEIVDRLLATKLDVSLPRASKQDAKIPPGDGSNLSLDILTFERIIAQVHADVLTALGPDPDDEAEALDELAIVNPDSVASAVALETIHRALASASAQSPADASLASLTSLYRSRAAAAAQRTIVPIDLDGDGIADTTRRLAMVNFIRN